MYSENMPRRPPPVLGEPLPVELANTRFLERGRERDGLESRDDLADWLARVGERLPLAEHDRAALEPADLAAARELRDALRTLLEAAAAGRPLDARAAEVLNRRVRAAPRWHELTVAPHLAASVHTAAPPVAAALAAIAEAGIALLAGPGAHALRACPSSGCMLLFVKDHPRRAWCSPRCSSRARSARHYARRTRRDGA
jgi:predicted RNA-binding Zn ribbon-like protein